MFREKNIGFLAMLDYRSRTPSHDAEAKALLLSNRQYLLLLSSTSLIDVAEGTL